MCLPGLRRKHFTVNVDRKQNVQEMVRRRDVMCLLGLLESTLLEMLIENKTYKYGDSVCEQYILINHSD